MNTNNKPRFADGQAVTPDDLHAISNQMRAFIIDQVIGGVARNSFLDLGLGPDLCYVPQAAHAYPLPGGSALQVTNGEGVLCQKVGSIDGVTPQVLAYRVAAGDLLTTLGTGDGTYERIDGIFIKIADDVAGDSQSRDFEDAVTRELSSQTTNVKFRTSIVKSVVPGTPSATPVKPATPSGYVPWCYVRVPSTYASTFDPTHISDWRVPMRVGAVDVMAREMIPDSGISLSADTAYFDMGAAANVAVNAIFPFGPDCRLLAAELHGDFNISHGTSDGEIDMVPSRLNLDVFPYTTGGGLSGNSDALWADFGSHVNSIFHSMMDRNVAFWGNGYAAGMAANQGGQEGGKKLELNVIYQQSAGSAQTAKLSFVRFYYAY